MSRVAHAGHHSKIHQEETQRSPASTSQPKDALSEEQLAQYFARIKLLGSHDTPDLELLTKVLWGHTSNIAYENLSCYHPKVKTPEISLEVADLYQKMVLHRRGGYCFEQNLLMAAALRKLGFDLYTSAGRVVVWDQLVPGSTHVPMKGLSHMAILVNLDGQRYLVDADFMRVPVPLIHHAERPEPDDPLAAGGVFRLRRAVTGSTLDVTPEQEATMQHRLGWYLQSRSRPDAPWKDLFFLLEVEFHLPDYGELNYFTSHAPNLFTQGVIMHVQTRRGRATMQGPLPGPTRLHVFEDGALVIDEEVTDFEAACEEHLGIVL